MLISAVELLLTDKALVLIYHALLKKVYCASMMEVVTHTLNTNYHPFTGTEIFLANVACLHMLSRYRSVDSYIALINDLDFTHSEPIFRTIILKEFNSCERAANVKSDTINEIVFVKLQAWDYRILIFPATDTYFIVWTNPFHRDIRCFGKQKTLIEIETVTKNYPNLFESSLMLQLHAYLLLCSLTVLYHSRSIEKVLSKTLNNIAVHLSEVNKLCQPIDLSNQLIDNLRDGMLAPRIFNIANEMKIISTEGQATRSELIIFTRHCREFNRVIKLILEGAWHLRATLTLKSPYRNIRNKWIVHLMRRSTILLRFSLCLISNVDDISLPDKSTRPHQHIIDPFLQTDIRLLWFVLQRFFNVLTFFVFCLSIQHLFIKRFWILFAELLETGCTDDLPSASRLYRLCEFLARNASYRNDREVYMRSGVLLLLVSLFFLQVASIRNLFNEGQFVKCLLLFFTFIINEREISCGEFGPLSFFHCCNCSKMFLLDS